MTTISRSNPVEREVAQRALDHECPVCGAKPGVRCRILTRNVTNPKRTKVDVRQKPCGGRVTLAWREWLGEHYGAKL